MRVGRLAQWLEHRSYIPSVRGSNPLAPTPHLCRGSQGGHGAALKKLKFRFDSGPRHLRE